MREPRNYLGTFSIAENGSNISKIVQEILIGNNHTFRITR